MLLRDFVIVDDVEAVFHVDSAPTFIVENAPNRLAFFRRKLPHAMFADNPQDAMRILKTGIVFKWVFL